VAERLRHATAEGRLSADELGERLEALYSARTYGELDVLLADLPVSSSPDQPRVRVPRWLGAAGAVTLLLTVLGLLAGAVRHSAEGSEFAGPPAGPHHLMVAAASMVALVGVLAICATLLWLLMRSRDTSDG
jgi:hypothetical protein